METPSLSSSVLDARRWLKSVYRKGADCPCCGQRVQLYRRSLNRAMVRALTDIYRAAGRDWVRIADIVGKRADEAKLVHWGLLEEQYGRREDGGRKGTWRVTEKGERFLRGEISVPRYVLLYNSKFRDFEGPDITVTKVLSDFNLRELLRGQG